jgi:hypothetical protein
MPGLKDRRYSKGKLLSISIENSKSLKGVDNGKLAAIPKAV